MPTYYKAFRRNSDGQLVSSDVEGKLLTVYPLGEWTRPKYGPVFITEYPDDYRVEGLEVWSVEVENVQPAPHQVMDNVFQKDYLIRNVRKFWMVWRTRRISTGRFYSRPGTWLADAIRPLSREY